MSGLTRWMRVVGVLYILNASALYLGWIVFHAVVIVTGVMALRSAASERQEPVLVAL